MEDEEKQGGMKLNRKKSCSMGSLSKKSSGDNTPESGRSSVSGSCSSLHGEPVIFPVKTEESPAKSFEDTRIWVTEASNQTKRKSIATTEKPVEVLILNLRVESRTSFKFSY